MRMWVYLGIAISIVQNVVNKFIEYVIFNYSKSEKTDELLIFKHHPRDRGYNNYSKLIDRLSRKYGVSGKVFYIHDYPLSKIFMSKLCSGTILINSTVGYQSLFHSVRVKALGIAPYNMSGLTHQDSLISFFESPLEVDRILFSKFYNILENFKLMETSTGFFLLKMCLIFKVNILNLKTILRFSKRTIIFLFSLSLYFYKFFIIS